MDGDQRPFGRFVTPVLLPALALIWAREEKSRWSTFVLAVAAFVPLWRRAARTFSRTRLIVFVALGAAVSAAVPVLIFVMLAAGTIRG